MQLSCCFDMQSNNLTEYFSHPFLVIFKESFENYQFCLYEITDQMNRLNSSV